MSESPTAPADAPQLASPVVSSEDRTLPAVTYALYLVGLATAGLTAILGLIIAYASRGSASAAMQSHYTFLIRTFWMTIGWTLIGGLIFLVSLPLSLILIGIPGLVVGATVIGLVGIWFAVRVIVGVIYLAQGQAYPRPNTWLI